eukprot:291853-Ditylum_brightwellii.AAC.1
MIAFGKKSTLICYRNEYFNYKGVVGEDRKGNDEDKNGLAIGAYEAGLTGTTAWQSSNSWQKYGFPPTTNELPTLLEMIDKILPDEEWKEWKKK